jgi:hypothetical protein
MRGDSAFLHIFLPGKGGGRGGGFRALGHWRGGTDGDGV